MRMCLLIIGMFLACVLVSAQPVKPALTLKKVDLYVDGHRAELVKGDIGVPQSALITNSGCALIPASVLQDSLGNPLDTRLWQWGIAQFSDRHDVTVAVKVNEMTAFVYAAEDLITPPTPIALPVAPLLYNNSVLYVPVTIIEQFGHTVHWDAKTHAIHLHRNTKNDTPDLSPADIIG